VGKGFNFEEDFIKNPLKYLRKYLRLSKQINGCDCLLTATKRKEKIIDDIF
jgi:hypothetical protein